MEGIIEHHPNQEVQLSSLCTDTATKDIIWLTKLMMLLNSMHAQPNLVGQEVNPVEGESSN
jgi:hypothetical protein